MTSQQVQEAIEFNEGQPFAQPEIEMIQRVVGTKVDGVWGPKTVEAIWQWQQDRGIPADGKIWRSMSGNTWPKIVAAADENGEDTHPNAPCLPQRKGVWVDDSHRIQQEPYMDRMLELGLNVAALMLDTTQRAWDPVYTDKEIETVAKLAELRDIELVLTVWPFPDRSVIDKLAADVQRILTIAPEVIRAVEGDAEFNWRPNQVKGFNDLDQAGDYYVNKLTEACEPTKARRELTTFTSHTENGRAADVAPHMDVIFGQAYSVRHRKKRDGSEWLIPWSHLYGPGGMQRHTLERSLQVPGVPERVALGCGLPAYDQSWPGRDPKEAMRVAYNAAIRHRVVEVRWWSFKWLIGHLSDRTPYAAEFLKEIA